MIFEYNSKIDFEPEGKGSILFMRLMGLFSIISGVIYFLPFGKEKGLLDILFVTVFMLTGVIYLIYPKWGTIPYFVRNDYIIIDEEIIKWKFGRARNRVFLRFDEIEKIAFYVGEVHFTTKQGGTHKLESYKIHNTIKHKQFYEVMRGPIHSKVNTKVVC